MGWGSGGSLFGEVVDTIKGAAALLDTAGQKRLWGELIDSFESMDCDTLYEVIEYGDDVPPLLVEVWNEKNPEEED